ncbi:MAG: F0F1 ATP synthase subunit epsilon [Flavobacteriales bacterium]|nr:F0F1 ATP synthase subunit epsilon [Flavobacteriales bacterium]
MEGRTMHLRILLPSGVFADVPDVRRMVVESTDGYFGLLPHRLDGTLALVPGILHYETLEKGEVYLAIDEGILVKIGHEVSVSVRHATGGADLGHLREAVEREFLALDEHDQVVRSALARLESGFLRRLERLQKGA